MKKTAKRFLALFLVMTMAVIAPVGVQAADTVKKADTSYVTYYPKTKYYDNAQQVSNSENARFTSLKSSKKSVATVSCRKDKWGYAVYVLPKKTGTTYVSYKLQGVAYKQKVVVNKYVNPYKKVTVNGQNITKQFKKTNVAVVSYKKYKNKKVTIKYEMKKNWGQPHADYCVNGKIAKCFVSFGNKLSIKKPKKNSSIEASIFNRKNYKIDPYSIIMFK